MAGKTDDLRKTYKLPMRANPEATELMLPENPSADDIPFIADLAQEMKEYFPGFVRSEFELLLKDKIEKNEVLIIRHQCKIAGCILFSHTEREIEFLAVSSNFRKKGAASRLMITAMSEFAPNTEISVVTYREEDAIGKDARRFYKKFGFKEREYLTVFDYPCQRLVGRTFENISEVRQCCERYFQ